MIFGGNSSYIKPNIGKEEHVALREFSVNKEIKIRKTEKRGGVVLLNTCGL